MTQQAIGIIELLKLKKTVNIEGARYVKGPRTGIFTMKEPAINIQLPDGTMQTIPVDNNDYAAPVHIEYVLDGMGGIDDPELRAAVIKYLTELIKDCKAMSADPKNDGYKVSDLDDLAYAFIDGYNAALKRAITIVKQSF